MKLIEIVDAYGDVHPIWVNLEGANELAAQAVSAVNALTPLDDEPKKKKAGA